MPISKDKFRTIGKEVTYKKLFAFLKKHKNTAYTRKELMEIICNKIGMKIGQLNMTLHEWNKKGYIRHKTPYYIISKEGLKTDGSLSHKKGKLV